MKKNILKILIVLSLFLPIFLIGHYLSIFYFQNDLNRLSINLETIKDIGDLLVCFDDECDNIKNDKNIYSYKVNQENLFFYKDFINIELILNNQNDFDYIKTISLFNGNNLNFFKKSDLKIKSTKIENIDKFSINIPFASRNKTVLQKVGVYFESIFYNWYFYLISYILVVVYFLIYKDRFNFKIKNLILPVLLLAFILRLSHIDFIPLWNDELYTLTVVSQMGKNIFKNAFIDPGNPPLFFILSNIWLYIFNKSVFLIRLLPLILGVGLVYVVYFVVKNVLNKKTALISAFLASINIFIIVESNEIRSYILSMSLILLGAYSFYRLLKDFSVKNIVFYSLVALFLANLHYYCLIFVIFNFLLGMFLFSQKKKFFIANIIPFLTFLIYFAFSYKFSLNENFNLWLSKPTLDVILNHITFYFGNIYWLILTVIFSMFIYKKLDNLQKKIILYLVSAIAFVFLFAFIFSFAVKPILFERYFCIFLPFLIIITSIFLTFDYKTKFKPLILVIILLFSINIPKYENFNLFSNIYFMAKYSTIDSELYDKNTDIYYIIPDNIKYLDYFKKDFKNVNKENIVVSQYGIRENIDLVDSIVKNSKKNKVVIYLPEICTNLIIKKKYNAKKINTTILPVYKIFVIK